MRFKLAPLRTIVLHFFAFFMLLEVVTLESKTMRWTAERKTPITVEIFDKMDALRMLIDLKRGFIGAIHRAMKTASCGKVEAQVTALKVYETCRQYRH
jgi:hypothetical protein